MGDANGIGELTDQVEGVISALVALVALVVVVATYGRTRSIVPTFGVIVVAALSIWAVHNVEVIQDLVGRDVGDTGVETPLQDPGS